MNIRTETINSDIESTIRQRIDNFNHFLLEQDVEKMPLGLFYGKTGLAVYFYYQARLTKNRQYEHFAGQLLDSVYVQIYDRMKIDVANGLTGICYGLNYLLKNNFVKGNPNRVLKELDDKIFNVLYFDFLEKSITKLEDLITVVHCAHYFCNRLINNRLVKEERKLLEKIVIKCINTVESSVAFDKMKEACVFLVFDYFPAIYFSLIYKMYLLGFYNYKIQKVCDEWSNSILATIPLMGSHRLLLASILEKVNTCCHLPKWEKHIELLRYGIDIKVVLQTDFRNKNINIYDGLSGFCLFLYKNAMITNGIKEVIAGKIAGSEKWSEFEFSNDEAKLYNIGLISGLAGVILTYQKLFE